MHPITKLLTTVIIILALLSAGCTDTGGGSVQSPTPDSTPKAEPTEKPTEIQPTPMQEQIDNWWDDKPGFHDAEVGIYSTLFGDVDGVKTSSLDGLVYDIYDTETGQHILTSQEYPNFDLYSELQPEQARALEDQYGSMKSVVMEQADTDGDGALDTVAVRYEGSKGTLEFETEFWTSGTGVDSYIRRFLVKGI